MESQQQSGFHWKWTEILPIFRPILMVAKAFPTNYYPQQIPVPSIYLDLHHELQNMLSDSVVRNFTLPRKFESGSHFELCLFGKYC